MPCACSFIRGHKHWPSQQTPLIKRHLNVIIYWCLLWSIVLAAPVWVFYFSCHEAWSLRLPRLTAVLTVAGLINVSFWQSPKGRRGRVVWKTKMEKNIFFCLFNNFWGTLTSCCLLWKNSPLTVVCRCFLKRFFCAVCRSDLQQQHRSDEGWWKPLAILK